MGGRWHTTPGSANGGIVLRLAGVKRCPRGRSIVLITRYAHLPRLPLASRLVAARVSPAGSWPNGCPFTKSNTTSSPACEAKRRLIVSSAHRLGQIHAGAADAARARPARRRPGRDPPAAPAGRPAAGRARGRANSACSWAARSATRSASRTCTSAATRIKFVTEGILLRQMIDDPKLRGVSALIFDEFHERHLYGDITLARALDIQEQQRPGPAASLVMSATLDARLARGTISQPLRRADAPKAARIPGRRSNTCRTRRATRTSRPVWELAAEAFGELRPLAAARATCWCSCRAASRSRRPSRPSGSAPESKGYLLLPLHGELPPRDQDAAVARYDQPKVVVSTNVAETSLTIDGVRLVIDSGLARIPRYDPEPRHQHAADREDQPGRGRPARRAAPAAPRRACASGSGREREHDGTRRRRNCPRSSGSTSRKSC